MANIYMDDPDEDEDYEEDSPWTRPLRHRRERELEDA
jgi:hypothetical protein